MADYIKAIPEELHALQGKLATLQREGETAVSNVQRVRSGLIWEVSAKAAVDEQLAALQKRLQTQAELMNGYAGLASKAAAQFESKDKELRDKAKDILYQMDQITYVNTNIETIVPTLDFELAEALKQLMTIIGIFGGVTAPVIALIEYLIGLINGPIPVPVPLPPVPPVPVPPEPVPPPPEPEPPKEEGLFIYFDICDGKTAPTKKAFKKGDKYALPATPKNGALPLWGWFSQKDGKGTEIKSGAVCNATASHTIYAWWPSNLVKKPIGTKITSGYRTTSRPDHNGVDYSAGVGNAIYAAVSGTVEGVKGSWKYEDGVKSSAAAGNYVTIRGIDKRKYEYFHLSAVSVKKGQKVNSGTLIGKSGNTGNVLTKNSKGVYVRPAKGSNGGSHLHFGIKQANNTYMNPTKIVGTLTTILWRKLKWQ